MLGLVCRATAVAAAVILAGVNASAVHAQTLEMSWHTAKVKTFEDLQKNELLVPGTGAGADSEIIPLAFNSFAGTKFKIVAGYRNTSEAALAMERGELEGLAYWSWSALKS